MGIWCKLKFLDFEICNATENFVISKLTGCSKMISNANLP